MRNKYRYHEEWLDKIRPLALQRANYMCQKCKAKHRSTGYRDSKGVWIACDKYMIEWCLTHNIKVKKLFLQVAHLDNNPSNNDITNLAVLCPRCHLMYDKDIRLIMRKSR